MVVGSSSYDAADWAFQYHGCELERIPVDDQGINIDVLADLCEQKTVKMVYVTPHHHFPTTVTLSNTRRIQLLKLSIRYNFIILEKCRHITISQSRPWRASRLHRFIQ